jgi:hypothetical protein
MTTNGESARREIMRRRSDAGCILITISAAILSATINVGSGISPPSSKVLSGPQAAHMRSAGPHGTYALLIGCTKYDNRPRLSPLVGPANDVELMRHVLEDSYGVDAKNIVVLSEASALKSGKDYRPVRKAIEREFHELTRKAKTGDEIVILLSGHGSQQPDDEDPKRADKLDGLDEIFLPADIGEADAAGRIPNAVIDDELSKWTNEIAKSGAHVFFVADCCHSGTLLRGDVEVSREVPADQLSSPRAIEAARERARRNPPQNILHQPSEALRGQTVVHEQSLMNRSRDGVVGLYAARSDETAPERPMPYGDASASRYGVLTFALCKLLADQAADKNAAALTYRELGQRIQAQYLAWGRLNGPTPFVDASAADIDREVLRTIVHVGRSRIELSWSEKAGWTINVGRLHGFTKDSVLVVYSADTTARPAKPLGHVVVTESRVVDSSVAPIKYGETPEPASLPKRGICTAVKLDFGELRIPVAIDKGDSPEAADYAAHLSAAQRERLAKLEAQLKERENEPDSPFRIVTTLAAANWAVHYRGRNLFLMPVDAAQVPDEQPLRGGTPWVGISDEQTPQDVATSLASIARAQNLIAIAKNARHDSAQTSQLADVDTDAPRIQVELLKCEDKNDQLGSAVQLHGTELELRSGDWIAFRVTNTGRVPIDFTLLFIDSSFGITSIYPTRFGADNRLEGSGNPQARSFRTRAYRVNDRTLGHEYLVAIAVPGTSGSAPADFTFLAQTDAEMRQRSGAANGARSLDSALGRLLRQAMYHDGGKRGLDSHEVAEHDAELLSWVVRK